MGSSLNKDDNALQQLLVSLSTATADQEQWSVRLQQGIDLILDNPSLTNSLEKLAANLQLADDVKRKQVAPAQQPANAQLQPEAAGS